MRMKCETFEFDNSNKDYCNGSQTGVVVLNIFYFHPYLWKIPNLTNIFQLG